MIKKTLLAVLISGLMSIVVQARDTSGGKEGGGGIYIDVDGEQTLLERAEKKFCEKFTAKEFVAKKLSHFGTTLKALESMNWYFARRIEKSLDGIEVCVSKAKFKLRQSEVQCDDVIFAGEYEQAAIRRGNKVFITKSSLKANSAEARALQAHTFFHELAHDYIPHAEKDACWHISRVRTLVDKVAESESKVISAAEFDKILVENSVNTPAAAEIDPYKQDLQTVFDVSKPDVERMKAGWNAASVLRLLTPEDVQLVDIWRAKYEGRQSELMGWLKDAIDTQDRALLKKALAEGADPNGVIKLDRKVDKGGKGYSDFVDYSGIIYLHTNPLIYALMRGSPETVKAFLETPGLEVNASDGFGFTPIHRLACDRKDRDKEKILMMLLDVPGLNVNALGAQLLYQEGMLRSEPYQQHFLSCLFRDPKLLEKALAKRPDIDPMAIDSVVKGFGWDPTRKYALYQTAALYDVDVFLQYALKYPGFNVNIKDDDGNSLLMSTVVMAPKSFALLLAQPGIDVCYRSPREGKNGKTEWWGAYDIAKYSGKKKEMKILKDLMKKKGCWR